VLARVKATFITQPAVGELCGEPTGVADDGKSRREAISFLSVMHKGKIWDFGFENLLKIDDLLKNHITTFQTFKKRMTDS